MPRAKHWAAVLGQTSTVWGGPAPHSSLGGDNVCVRIPHLVGTSKGSCCRAFLCNCIHLVIMPFLCIISLTILPFYSWFLPMPVFPLFPPSLPPSPSSLSSPFPLSLPPHSPLPPSLPPSLPPYNKYSSVSVLEGGGWEVGGVTGNVKEGWRILCLI